MTNKGIVDTLLARDGALIRPYFDRPSGDKKDQRIWGHMSKAGKQEGDKWVADFRKRSHGALLDHDEPWLTLVALCGLFGDQSQLDDPKRVSAVNQLLATVFHERKGEPSPPRFDELLGVQLEVGLPQNLPYRKYLRETVFAERSWHLYPDRLRRLEEKRKKGRASLEGSTYVDAIISGRSAKRHIHVFLEAKFLSDISGQITYVPVRNQLARNIDCIIDVMTDGGSDLEGLHDFWFVLLTPGIFRIEDYGGSCDSPIACFQPTRSRFYCYKMLDYLQPEELRRDLPHVDMSDRQWREVSRRIGWMTYEEIVEQVLNARLLAEPLLTRFCSFFEERQLSGGCC